ncbi:hypothetical protein RHGRI_006683 [Rhododendron griersonianum]|uniref:CCHC-type domain-containing protein n=1 Tax=Rhododendron griersonianum TaxID=479676 RepID=A0AAV6KUM9_9ERIC|nr:hypothetical protein RHGRI_006683 [Rhododendron griersonianum]
MARNSDKPLGGHFTIQIHHGGKFFNRPTIRALGYTGMINYYYVMTGKNIKNGLRMLLTDSDIIEMIKQLPPSRTVDMYIEPINPIELMESQSDEGGPTPTPTDKGSPTQTQKGCPTQTDKGSKSDKGGLSQTGKGSRSDKGGRSQTDKGSKSDKGGPSQTGKGSRSDKGGPSHDVNYEDFLVDDAFFEDGFCDGTTYDGVDVQDLGDKCQHLQGYHLPHQWLDHVEREELENPDADKLKRQNTSLRCGKCGQWGHNIRSCKNEVNPDIRRRPSGGLVFSRPTGKPRGRPRQGGRQASSSRGRGVVAAPTEEGQALRGRGDAGRGRGGGGRGRGRTDGGSGRRRGRGRTDGGRGRGDGGRGRGDGGRGRGFGSTSQPPPAQTSQAPAQY